MSFLTGAVSGNGISGVNGDCLTASGKVLEVCKWSWKPKIEQKEYASNKTGGFKRVILSNKMADGSIDGVWDPWDPITDHMDVGTYVALHLQTVALQYWNINALVTDMDFTVDIESGDVEKWTASLKSNGAWINPTPLAATTTTTTTTPAPLMGGAHFDEAGQLDLGDSEGVRDSAPQAANQAQSPRQDAGSGFTEQHLQSIADKVFGMMKAHMPRVSEVPDKQAA